MIEKLLLGTGNPKKVEHYKEFLRDFKGEIFSVKDLAILEPVEDAATLEENAVAKAKYYFQKAGFPALADDGGFEIPALNNFPGVKSKRFAGKDLTDQETIEEILKRMRGLVGEQRKARFRVVVALAQSPYVVHTASGVIEGVVPEKPYEKIMPHFPYRSLLFVTAMNKWFYEVTEEEEERLGYRKAAVERLKKFLF
ncbi:MAG: non-canonical purine NTP pyrophosphatase [Patescibacteria group bacterium]